MVSRPFMRDMFQLRFSRVSRSMTRLASEAVDLEHVPHDLCDTLRKERGHGVTDLDVLLRARAAEEIVVWKRLKACALAHRETSALGRVGMNEAMPVLGNVARDRGRRTALDLHTKAIGEISVAVQRHLNVAVLREQVRRKMSELR